MKTSLTTAFHAVAHFKPSTTQRQRATEYGVHVLWQVQGLPTFKPIAHHAPEDHVNDPELLCHISKR